MGAMTTLIAAILLGVLPPGDHLVVIGPRKLLEPLGPFIAARSSSLPTVAVPLETVLATQDGADTPEKVKRFLYGRWQKGARFALLVGDADQFPVRYMVLDRVTREAFDTAFYPSDLYYADVARADGSFDDWNGRREGHHAFYFGEVRGEKHKDDPINYDGMDLRPDIAVGRWPVSDPQEALRLAEKTLACEEALRRPGGRRAAFFCVDGWIDARAALDGVARRLPSAWTVERRFFGGAPGDPAPDEKELVRLVNEGVGFVAHAGHGHDLGWEKCLTAAGVARLRNRDRLPILMSVGCSTARFATLPPYEPYTDIDGQEHAGTNHGEVFTAAPPPPLCFQRGSHNPRGLGEELLRAGPNGAAAYIGCNTGSQPCALTLLDGLVRGMAAKGPRRLGDAWNAALVHYVEAEKLASLRPTESWYPASIFFQGMKFMLFGDPALPIP